MPETQAPEEVIIVDTENKIIGTAPRWRMRKERLIHRATYCLVFSDDGRLFVQKRTATKDIYPACWEIAAGGVVAAGETYEGSVRRELGEELGVEVESGIESLFDFFYEDEENAVWGRVFKCVHNGPFTLQEEEVEEGRFVTLDELRAMLRTHEFTPDNRELFRRLDEMGWDRLLA